MANCDWGSPCTCRRCRTQYRKEICYICGFENVVEVEGDGEILRDRKNIRYAKITMPTGDPMDLTCFKCGNGIKDREFYTRIAIEACKRNVIRDELLETSEPCDDCNVKIERILDDYQPIQLSEYKGAFLCKECLSKRVKTDSQDPSNSKEKYIFDNRQLKWVLFKVKVICKTCGKPRWLKAENSWKKQCLSCFKKQIEPAS